MPACLAGRACRSPRLQRRTRQNGARRCRSGVDAQERDLRAVGAEEMYREQTSSVGTRAAIVACLKFLRKGDAVAVTQAGSPGAIDATWLAWRTAYDDLVVWGGLEIMRAPTSLAVARRPMGAG
jgi:hypothetical protein